MCVSSHIYSILNGGSIPKCAPIAYLSVLYTYHIAGNVVYSNWIQDFTVNEVVCRVKSLGFTVQVLFLSVDGLIKISCLLSVLKFAMFDHINSLYCIRGDVIDCLHRGLAPHV